ncbi:MAG: CPBP family intramembrane metalloprotease [Eubacterium sp.]|nr:CPBP family intramembrane metalloprotease [Eubacterium sp.]
MSKIKNFFENISPLNNRTEMPMILYIIKVIIIFWFVKFGSELIGEAIVIGLHFICGKNPLKGEMFDPGTIMLITYYGYGIMIGTMFLYWKLFQKKTLAELGFTKKACTYFVGAFAGLVLIIVSVVSVGFTGALTYHGLFSDIDYIYILLMLGGFICQGAMEEVLCRGIVLQLLKDKTGIPVVVGVSTALFIIHILIK